MRVDLNSIPNGACETGMQRRTLRPMVLPRTTSPMKYSPLPLMLLVLVLHKAIHNRFSKILIRWLAGVYVLLLRWKEQSHIAAISALETKRIEAMEKSGHAARSIEEIAGSFSEYSILIPFQKQLIDIIQDIKYANDLNNQLLTQSLQLIHTELDLLVPSKREDSFNYTKTNNRSFQSNSIFNSKA